MEIHERVIGLPPSHPTSSGKEVAGRSTTPRKGGSNFGLWKAFFAGDFVVWRDLIGVDFGGNQMIEIVESG